MIVQSQLLSSSCDGHLSTETGSKDMLKLNQKEQLSADISTSDD